MSNDDFDEFSIDNDEKYEHNYIAANDNEYNQESNDNYDQEHIQFLLRHSILTSNKNSENDISHQPNINFSSIEIRRLSQKNVTQFARFIEKYNVNVKKTTNGQYYVWDDDKKIYKSCKKSDAIINKEYHNLCEVIIENAFRSECITEETFEKLLFFISNPKNIVNMKSIIVLTPDEKFEKLLNVSQLYLPIKGGKKINLKTLQVSERTRNDYWTFEIDATFNKSLRDDNNVFVQFLKSMWDDPEEYQFIEQLIGYMVTPLYDQNLLIIWQHSKGGGGKTIFINTLWSVLRQFVCKLDRKNILSSSGTARNELNKLKKRRIAFIDEALDHNHNGKNVNKKPILLNTLLELTGGGALQERDCYQRGVDTSPFENHAKLILFGNDSSFDSSTHGAVNRRIVFCPLLSYYRNEDDDGFDENDPHCKPKDMKIKQKLLNAKDDVLTFCINAAHKFLANQIDLAHNQPPRFKEEWKKTYDKQTIFNEFINEQCIINENETTYIGDFVTAINKHTKTNHYTQRNIKKYLKEWDEEIKFKYIIKDNKKKRYLTGITIQKNTSILSNDPQY